MLRSVQAGTAEVRKEAASIWPDVDWSDAVLERGAFHDVLIAASVVARLSRSRFAADAVPAQASFLRRIRGKLPTLDVPDVVGDPMRWSKTRAGVLLSFLPGQSRSVGEALPADELAHVLDVVHNTDRSVIEDEVVRSWCGGERFIQIVADEIGPALSAKARTTAVRVVAELLEAEAQAPHCVVHGDLTPFNIRWEGDRAIGLLDWDFAAIGDPALDLAGILTTVGTDVARVIGDSASVERATLHRATFPLQIACAGLLHDDDRLRKTGIRNFEERLRRGVLHWPAG